MNITRQMFLKGLVGMVASVPALFGLNSLKSITGFKEKTGFETSAPEGHVRVELICDSVPDGMRYRPSEYFPYYCGHPFVELEWWLGTSRKLIDDFNSLGWQFTHLPKGEISLTLWEYAECKAEGAHITILLEPMVEEINQHDSTNTSVVWEVRAVQDGCGIHGCVPWDEMFGDHGTVRRDNPVRLRTAEREKGKYVIEPAAFQFVEGDDSIREIAEWMVRWMNLSVVDRGYYIPSIRDGKKYNSVLWEVREAPDLDTYTEEFRPFA